MTTEINIERFCGKNDPREWLLAPFKIGTDLCATNGHIICRVHGAAADKHPEPTHALERLNELLEQIEQCDVAEVGDVELPDPAPCKTCNGSGKASAQKCLECDGDGEVDAETGHNTYYGLTCKSCGGDGELVRLKTEESCDRCDGSGKDFGRARAWFNGVVNPIQARYYEMIKDLPGLKIGFVHDSHGNLSLVAFKFDGGDGCVMPVNETRGPANA